MHGDQDHHRAQVQWLWTSLIIHSHRDPHIALRYANLKQKFPTNDYILRLTTYESTGPNNSNTSFPVVKLHPTHAHALVTDLHMPPSQAHYTRQKQLAHTYTRPPLSSTSLTLATLQRLTSSCLTDLIWHLTILSCILNQATRTVIVTSTFV